MYATCTCSDRASVLHATVGGWVGIPWSQHCVCLCGCGCVLSSLSLPPPPKKKCPKCDPSSSCVRPFFFPSSKVMVARTEVKCYRIKTFGFLLCVCITFFFWLKKRRKIFVLDGQPAFICCQENIFDFSFLFLSHLTHFSPPFVVGEKKSSLCLTFMRN